MVTPIFKEYNYKKIYFLQINRINISSLITTLLTAIQLNTYVPFYSYFKICSKKSKSQINQ